MGGVSEPREAGAAYEPETAETTEVPQAVATERPRRVRRWVRGRSVRWVVLGAAVVVLGGGAAAVAVHHGERHGEGHRFAAGEREHGRPDGSEGGRHGDGQGEGRGDGWGGGRHGHHGQAGGDRTRGQAGDVTPEGAPAPLPSTDAAEALAKAAAAVSGGKVESLSPVTEQGGGRAWRAVILGPDGVRHAVTVDGASDTVTGNTVLDR